MIRRAEPKDAPRICALLRQVLEVHAAIRPDLFLSGTQKYSEDGVLALLKEPGCRIFAETDEADVLRGYCICYVQRVHGDGVMIERKELYIDDLCVDEACRRTGVANRLFDHVRQYAKDNGFDWITLNVWEGNDGAQAFYRGMGMQTRRTTMELRID
jgi:ribosomal protein S18 acetylase RimI-like enzyme